MLIRMLSRLVPGLLPISFSGNVFCLFGSRPGVLRVCRCDLGYDGVKIQVHDESDGFEGF